MKNYGLIFGQDMNENHLKQVYDIDCRNYKMEYQGYFDNYIKRHTLNKNTFVCVTNEHGEIVAYINFFPISDKLTEYILNSGDTIVDDDLATTNYLDETLQYTKCSKSDPRNNIFILSVVNDVHGPDKKQVSIILQVAFKHYLKSLEKDGYAISKIFGTTVTDAGRRFASRLGLKEYRKMNEEEIVYCT